MSRIARAVRIEFDAVNEEAATFPIVDHAHGVALLGAATLPGSRRDGERVAAAAAGFVRYLRLRVHSIGVSVTCAPLPPCCYISEGHDVVIGISVAVDWQHDVRHALLRTADVIVRGYPRLHPLHIPAALDTMWAASVDGRILRAGFRASESVERKLRRHIDALRAAAGGAVADAAASAAIRRAWGFERSWAALVALNPVVAPAGEAERDHPPILLACPIPGGGPAARTAAGPESSERR